jgi:glycosyltransferase A (GT-A) superfamily protein (DUF2064 family)
MDERSSIRPAALGIMCKAPRPGTTKTRLAAVVGSEQAALMAACFLRCAEHVRQLGGGSPLPSLMVAKG